MKAESYNVSNLSVNSLLGAIESKDIAIPEIQRPFVWKRSQVRDLIDSLYNGYPTGYIIVWKNPDAKLKNGESSQGKKIIIDGQQRITALTAAISGQEIIDENYDTVSIKIAFNPMAREDEERFAVQDSSHLKSPKWLPDISVAFKRDFDSFGFITKYCAENPDVSTSDINAAVIQLQSISNRQIGVIELAHQLSIDEVTEIFIRINSEGKKLNQSDFAMSKIAADEKHGGNMLRKAIDYFCHLAIKPEFYSKIESKDPEFMASEYASKIKWLKDNNEAIYDPDYGDMLRVSFMHKFKRGKMADLVSLLSGRDFEAKDFKEEIASESFEKLKDGVFNFSNEYSFTRFVLAIKSAGFISPKLINSQMTLNFAYTLYLLLSKDEKIDKNKINQYVMKWYVLSVLTGRYISSPESAMDSDMRQIASKGFEVFFRETEAAVLSDAFWDIGLVQNLETSSINSPYFSAFIASQIYAGANSLFMNGTKVSDLINTMGDVHHIFPKDYLKKSGVTERSKYNQVANYIYLDTQVNILIGNKAPGEYFSMIENQFETGNLKYGNISNRDDYISNLDTNCIPHSIINMDAGNFEEFLFERRKLIAQKIKKYWESL